PRGSNRHAVFLVHPREGLDYHYERNPADPRVAHELTLEVDDHGIVTQSASVAYPRRVPAYAEQGVLLVTCSEVELTPVVDTDEAWRTPMAWRTRTFELTGMSAAAGATLSLERVRQWVADAASIGYGTSPTAGVEEKRLLSDVRVRLLRDDLSGPLDFGQMESRALTWETYRLALPDALVTQVYAGRVDAPMLSAEGGYVQLAGAADWWAPSGRAVYAADAAAHFYLPDGVRDPFGQVTAVTYDAYDLLVTETRDPYGNALRATNDYRVLQPQLVTDANGNRAGVAFDALGRVAGMALLGQAGRGEGDDLTGFDPDPDEATVIAYGSDPLATGATLLGRATKCFVYDPWRFARTSREPALVASLAR
ncbi:MAG TPA: toxin TcdB middle/C-terminal domain-containing protein, partial [Gemmatimonadaceae bacterium]|nr:toxin TcdB middle/C-terminal domain-containing protein [Gemmatimonadaceae bacterium]